MNTQILKGAPVAAAINDKTRLEAEKLRAAGVEPCLALVRVGEKAEDMTYERGIIKRCVSVGVAARQLSLPADIETEQLVSEIRRLNDDGAVHGILVFLPLPAHIDTERVRHSVLPEKDVDGITDASMAAVYLGKGTGFPPCTAQAAIEMLKYYEIPLSGRRAAVLGRSLVIGRPVSMLLMSEDATVTVCHSKTEKMAETARDCDIIISAMGRAECVGEAFFSDRQTIIDVGINFTTDGKMCGDVDFNAAEGIVSAITPVPGGVGAVTTAILANNVVFAASKK